MPFNSRIFYQYLGLHSLLIGIFPFYLPVYFWKQGFDLSEISFFIAISGAGFCLGMWIWDRLRLKVNLTTIIALSLLLELGLLVNIYHLKMSFDLLLSLGLLYGIYNSFFWTTQRALFFDLIDTGSSGRKYGNFQIFVGVSLQIGILIGGVLLETTAFVYLLYLSAVIALIGFIILYLNRPEYPITLQNTPSLSIRTIFNFKDQESSRTIFLIDGFYLFLESFFWVITLFLLAHESFTTLGILVISLALIFGILFYLLKNTIDQLGRRRIYLFAAILYCASWGLRAVVEDTFALEILFVFLVVITFCTSFFRLAMNKRFYDIAKLTIAHDYLLLKSYYTQFFIIIGFSAIGFIAMNVHDAQTMLVYTYWAAAIGALVFLIYGAKRYSASS